MTGQNPQHNEHIAEQANVLNAAFEENNQMLLLFYLKPILLRLDKLEMDIEELKRRQDLADKNNTPTPLSADIFITHQSLNRAKKDLWRALN